MNDQFPTIKKIIYNYFNHQIDFSRDEGFEELMIAINLGDFKLSDIKRELEMLLKGEIDWRKFGIDSFLLPDRPEVSADYVRNYLLYCIHDAVWQGEAIKMSKREELVVTTYNVLKKHLKKGGRWLFYSELYEELTLLDSFKDLKFYNLNHIWIDGRGVFDLRIVNKGIESFFQISLNESYLEYDIFDIWESSEH